jgi:cysteine synthase
MQNAIELIGHTRLISLDRVHSGPGQLKAKAEFLQPGGSVKDRAARIIIEDALYNEKLVPGQQVVEMTGGNMGSGLAVMCAVIGNPLTVVMSAGNSPEHAKMLETMGARVVLVPQVDGFPGSVTGADRDAAARMARQIAADENAFYVDQFNNPSAFSAHEHGTGPEIWEQLAGRVDGFAACVGTGATFTGVARFFKRQRGHVICAAVEPEGAEVLAGKPVTKPRHKLQGTGFGTVPPLWDASLMDQSIAVSDDEAEEFRRLLARKEGLYVGYSAAANVAAACKLLHSGKFKTGATVVTVLCDAGWKYPA